MIINVIQPFAGIGNPCNYEFRIANPKQRETQEAISTRNMNFTYGILNY